MNTRKRLGLSTIIATIRRYSFAAADDGQPAERNPFLRHGELKSSASRIWERARVMRAAWLARGIK